MSMTAIMVELFLFRLLQVTSTVLLLAQIQTCPTKALYAMIPISKVLISVLKFPPLTRETKIVLPPVVLLPAV